MLSLRTYDDNGQQFEETVSHAIENELMASPWPYARLDISESVSVHAVPAMTLDVLEVVFQKLACGYALAEERRQVAIGVSSRQFIWDDVSAKVYIY
jgi:hypothetical protein